MKKFLIPIVIFFFAGCLSSKNKSKETIKRQLLLDDETFYIKDTTKDKTYGYKQFNAVRVANDRKASGPKMKEDI